MQLKGACIFGQSGGPTSVINSSAYGVFKTALESDCITRVLGAKYGIKGILNDDLIDIGLEDPKELELLLNTPSSALGSCRYKLKNASDDETDYKRILEIFKKYDVRYFFYNGGNDSMDTCNKISKYLLSKGYECRVIGVPKTIDNDLYGIDHCPGFGSAAKYIATTSAELARDAKVYDTGMVLVLECMGRNAGWLTAATAVAKFMDAEPDIISLPEVPFDMEKFLDRVEKIYKEKKYCFVAVSEGIKDSDGKFIAEYATANASKEDAFGHKQMGGVASYLAGAIKERTGAKTRGIELSLLQRCAAHCGSATDIKESFLMGCEAVKAAVSGITDKMVANERDTSAQGYKLKTKLIDLQDVANAEKKFPVEWIINDNTGISDEFFDYVLPLIEGQPDIKWEHGIPRFAQLKKVKA
ncbi:MAG: 6-phosphofructokinase [Clostridia bacterium]|nr:6-phosphofructokinase [Clostridia bacterium]